MFLLFGPLSPFLVLLPYCGWCICKSYHVHPGLKMLPIISRMATKLVGITRRALQDLTTASLLTPTTPHYTQCSCHTSPFTLPEYANLYPLLSHWTVVARTAWNAFPPLLLQNMPPLSWNAAQMPFCNTFWDYFSPLSHRLLLPLYWVSCSLLRALTALNYLAILCCTYSCLLCCLDCKPCEDNRVNLS